MILENYEYRNEIKKLSEREKELKCLYKVQEIINKNLPVEIFLMQIVKHIWGGWQYPIMTRVKIIFEGEDYKEDGWDETKWKQSSSINIDDKVSGRIEVFYTKPDEKNSANPFLPEEQKLLDAIAAKISYYIFNLRLVNTLKAIELDKKNETPAKPLNNTLLPANPDIHWHWRFKTANKIAQKLDLSKFAIKAMYLIGSVKEGTCGPASDIDILVHFVGTTQQKAEMKAWFEGWSLCLSEMNFEKTGYKTNGLIDLHIVTNEDISINESFATMINSRYNPAKLLKKNE